MPKASQVCTLLRGIPIFVSRHGVATDPATDRVFSWPTPTSMNEFLGLSSNYHCFVRNFAAIAKPRTN